NLERTAKGPAERVLRESGLDDRHVGPQLIWRAVERRPSEGVRRRSLVRALSCCSAAAQQKSVSSSEALAAAARSSGSSRKTGAAESAARNSIRRPEAGSELTRRRIELPQIDHVRAAAHQTAIEVGRVAAAAYRD